MINPYTDANGVLRDKLGIAYIAYATRAIPAHMRQASTETEALAALTEIED